MGILDACMKHALAQVKLMFGISILSWDTYDIINTQLHRGILPTLKIPKGLWATTTAVRDICDSVVHIYIYMLWIHTVACNFYVSTLLKASQTVLSSCAPEALLQHRSCPIARDRVWKEKNACSIELGKWDDLLAALTTGWYIYIFARWSRVKLIKLHSYIDLYSLPFLWL